MKPRPVTPEMQDVVGESVIPRTQALKRIWAYIKEHDLQVIYSVSIERLYLSRRLIPDNCLLIQKRRPFFKNLDEAFLQKFETSLELSKTFLTAYVD